MEKVLLYFALKYKGDWDKIYKALESKEKIELEDLTREISKIGSQTTTIISNNYPDALKYTYKPPFVMFYKGDIELLSNFGEKQTLATPDKNGSLNGYIKDNNNIKTMEVLNSGIKAHIEHNELNKDLIISESYEDYELSEKDITRNQLRFISSISNSVVLENYDEKLVEEINSYSTHEDFIVLLENYDKTISSKFSNVMVVDEKNQLLGLTKSDNGMDVN